MQYIEKNRETKDKKLVVSENYRQLDKWIMLSVIEITETSEVHKMTNLLRTTLLERL